MAVTRERTTSAKTDAADCQSTKYNSQIVNTLDAYGATLVHNTLTGGHVWHDFELDNRMEIAKFLLYQGVEVDREDKCGVTALLIAIRDDNVPMIRLLLSHGADANRARSQSHRTPLFSVWSKDAAQLLIEYGANVNHKDGERSTPLFGAVYGVAKLLLDHGADLEAKDQHGRTPLNWAIYRFDLASIKLLLKRGADVNAEYPSPQISIYSTLGDGHLEAFPIAFAEHKADLYHNQSKQKTSLHVSNSASDDTEAAINLLIRRDTGKDTTESDGQTLLLRSVNRGFTAEARLPVDQGVEVNTADAPGRTPLLPAVNLLSSTTVVQLLENGADVRLAGVESDSPFSVASRFRNGHERKWSPSKVSALDEVIKYGTELASVEPGFKRRRLQWSSQIDA